MEAATLILTLLVRYGPDVARLGRELLSSGAEPTHEDWEKLFQLSTKTYDSYIADAQKRAT